MLPQKFSAATTWMGPVWARALAGEPDRPQLARTPPPTTRAIASGSGRGRGGDGGKRGRHHLRWTPFMGSVYLRIILISRIILTSAMGPGWDWAATRSIWRRRRG